jgi:DNA polymerase III subunit epsilon
VSRQIVLDTETTGLEVSQGHRIIEIGAVELENRRLTGRHFHQYINPHRDIDEGAMQVHGITLESLQDKPDFADIADDFLSFIEGSELVIHNAPFDIGFLNYELSLLERSLGTVDQYASVLDSLNMARQMHPGQRNNLDALCKRYDIDNSKRELHGALLDAEILADVYLSMTGGQVGLGLDEESGDASDGSGSVAGIRRLPADRPALRIIRASAAEIELHQERLRAVREASGNLIWESEV